MPKTPDYFHGIGRATALCSEACEFITADTACVSGGGGWR